MASAVSTAATTAPPTPAVIPSSASSAALQQQTSQQQPVSYNGQGSINTMNEMYDVGEVIGTGTFGIIRKVSRRAGSLYH